MTQIYSSYPFNIVPPPGFLCRVSCQFQRSPCWFNFCVFFKGLIFDKLHVSHSFISICIFLYVPFVPFFTVFVDLIMVLYFCIIFFFWLSCKIQLIRGISSVLLLFFYRMYLNHTIVDIGAIFTRKTLDTLLLVSGFALEGLPYAPILIKRS